MVSDKKSTGSPLGLKIGMYVVTMALPFVLFAWTVPLVSATTIANDYLIFPISQQLSLQHSLEHDTWPLFVPGFAGGRPAAALTLGQIFHPQSHLAALLPGYWSGHANDWNTILRLLSLGGCHLMFLMLFRRLGLGWAGAFIVSLVAVYNMRLLDNFRYGASLENHTGHLLLVGAAAFTFLRPTRIVGPLGVGISLFLTVVGGHPQMMYFGLLGSAVMILCLPFVMSAISDHVPSDSPALRRYYKWIFISLGVGMLLSAAYVLPLYFDFVRDAGERVARTYTWSVGFGDSVGGVLNNLFDPLNANVSGAFGASAFFLVSFLAPVVILLRVRTKRVIFVLWIFVLLVYTLSFGEETPVHYLWWRYFPLASTFRVPGRSSMMLILPAAFILGWLFSRPSFEFTLFRARFIWSPVGAVSLLALLIYGLYNLLFHSFFEQPHYLTPMDIREIPGRIPSSVVILGAVTLALAALPRFKSWPKGIAGWLVVACLFVQTGIVFWHGTWIEDRRDTITKAQLEDRFRERFDFHTYPGNSMRSDAVVKQMGSSFLCEDVGKFYRKHVGVEPDTGPFEAAYLRTEDNIVVARKAPPSRGAGPPPNPGGIDEVETVESTYNRMVFQVENHDFGYFNFTLPDSKYWRGYVDGSEVTVYAANGGESAVFLKPGKHRVEFRFFSKAALAGMVLGLVGLFISLLFCSWSLHGVPRLVAALGSFGIVFSLGYLWFGSLYGGDDLGYAYRWTSEKIPDYPANLAFGKPTEMSSVMDSRLPSQFYAGLGVDGRRTGSFCTGSKTRSSWWQVDLGVKKRVRSVVLHETSSRESRRLLPLRIEAADSRDRFRTLMVVRNRGIGNGWHIPVDVTARYFRLRTDKRISMCFKEVELFGTTVR